ncbi:sialidase family protein [Pedobacter gandavensis]|uniref:exo-alpha-sialidase n=1 Tax=Pedobacter gandavensis TaxID=2679963 RepID=A0ABR6ERA9_9SPHI|nr:sialidase family protein [Pedobacter gandavensis]MBB2147780.1 glycosyl hydrolase [Pedobacter gandavensis]
MMISQHYKYAALSVLLLATGFTAHSQNVSTKSAGLTITAQQTVNPILKRKAVNPVWRMEIEVPAEGLEFKTLSGTLNKAGITDLKFLEAYLSTENKAHEQVLDVKKRIGAVEVTGKNFQIPLDAKLAAGKQVIWISATLKPEANIDDRIELKVSNLTDAGLVKHKIGISGPLAATRLGIALRNPNDDEVNSYRIPGITETAKGTLISVYDARYKNSGDLPGNIDVGMSRSTDGGKTWEPMKIIMDMGAPHENNGVGDPSVLFDPVTKTIWVAALWSKGNRSIAGSGPGLSEDETGQFAVTSSTDDGLTWSKPYSITNQVKNPKWRLFFPGPGNGIAMADGKIVFPAQYWDENKMPHSTLIYSADHGKTWKAGVGAKSNTTESQLVETTPGKLMLNMRDNRGKFRSVATTTDMGLSWETHATSYKTLIDPVCMASLIKARVKVKGKMKDVLFFSNPNSSTDRKDLTIKVSLDLGETWQDANLLVDDRDSFGYSALTKIDDQTLGLLYEGVRDLYFVRIPVNDLIK